MQSEVKSTGALIIEARSAGKRRQWWIIVLGLALAYLVLWRLQIILSWFDVQIGPTGPPSILIWNWVAVAGLVVYILALERLPLRSIGLTRPKTMDIVWAVAFWILGTITTGMIHEIAPPPPSDGLDTMLALSIPVLLAVIITASITEEVLYRGYMVERLRELTGYLWIGAAVSFILFVIPHVQFFGMQWLIYHSVSAVLIYILYVWRRNLFACMILHVLYNSLILIPALGH